MNKENRDLVDRLRKELRARQTSIPVKLESQRKMEERLGVGRQRIREALSQLEAEGLIIHSEGRAACIAPLIRNNYVNLLCAPSIKPTDPFYSSMLMDLTTYTARNNINIIPLQCDNLQMGNSDFPILLVGKFQESVLEQIQNTYTHIVSLENYSGHDDFVQIFYDHFQIGVNAARTLSSYGHKKAICITGPQTYSSARNRRDGFIKGASKWGLEAVVLETKMNFIGGNSLAERVGQLHEQGYTAVFAANDWMAVGLIQGLRAQGIDVPGDLSVLGVDNIPLANQFAPALTTYSLDANLLIVECFTVINQMKRDEELGVSFGPRKVILQPKLIVRDTLERNE